MYRQDRTTYVRYLQQFSDFFPTRVFFGGAILSSHYKNLQCGASILHHIGGLHKFWDGLNLNVKTTGMTDFGHACCRLFSLV